MNWKQYLATEYGKVKQGVGEAASFLKKYIAPEKKAMEFKVGEGLTVPQQQVAQQIVTKPVQVPLPQYKTPAQQLVSLPKTLFGIGRKQELYENAYYNAIAFGKSQDVSEKLAIAFAKDPLAIIKPDEIAKIGVSPIEYGKILGELKQQELGMVAMGAIVPGAKKIEGSKDIFINLLKGLEGKTIVKSEFINKLIKMTEADVEDRAAIESLIVGKKTINVKNFVNDVVKVYQDKIAKTRQIVSNVYNPKFMGFDDLTTKVLNSLKGQSEVAKEDIQRSLNQPAIKQGEKDLIGEILREYPDKVPVVDFANNVKAQLIPLQGKEVTILSHFTPSIFKKESDKSFEIVFESPIKTFGNLTHYGSKNLPNYFSHARIEDLKNNVRRVTEIQSDFFQEPWDPYTKPAYWEKEKGRLLDKQFNDFRDILGHWDRIKIKDNDVYIGSTKFSEFFNPKSAEKIFSINADRGRFLTLLENRYEDELILLRPSSYDLNEIAEGILDGRAQIKDGKVIFDDASDFLQKKIKKLNKGVISASQIKEYISDHEGFDTLINVPTEMYLKSDVAKKRIIQYNNKNVKLSYSDVPILSKIIPKIRTMLDELKTKPYIRGANLVEWLDNNAGEAYLADYVRAGREGLLKNLKFSARSGESWSDWQFSDRIRKVINYLKKEGYITEKRTEKSKRIFLQRTDKKMDFDEALKKKEEELTNRLNRYNELLNEAESKHDLDPLHQRFWDKAAEFKRFLEQKLEQPSTEQQQEEDSLKLKYEKMKDFLTNAPEEILPVSDSTQKNIQDIEKLKPYYRNWYQRTIRELVSQAAKDKKEYIDIPTGKTAIDIQEISKGSNLSAYKGIYNLYEDKIGRFLKTTYSDLQKVTIDGYDYWRIPLANKAKMPVEAFGAFAGLEYDEDEDKWKYNPATGAAGLGGMALGAKLTPRVMAALKRKGIEITPKRLAALQKLEREMISRENLEKKNIAVTKAATNLISNSIKKTSFIDSSTKKILTSENLRIDQDITDLSGEKWIITKILGPGKFEAITKKYWIYVDELPSKYSDKERYKMISDTAESFDISKIKK